MENKDRDVFGRARQEAVLDKIHETAGTASAQVLDQVARKAEGRAIEKMGEESERRFVAYAKRTDIVKFVRNASPQDDVFRGIDKWVTLSEDLELPELPVQVKSSFRDVRLYKYGDPNTGRKPDPAFTHLNGIEIVLNCGRAVNPKNFKKQLHEEIRRIRLTLKGNPSLADSIKG
jgi:hypothetical protein